jgi:Fe-S oxidoreductase
MVIEWDESCHEMTHLNTLHYIKPNFEMKNIEQFIAENLRKLKFAKPIKKKIAIHDHYGHADNSYADMDSPRKVLGAIPGVELLELDHNRLAALPCGFEAMSYKGQKEEGKRQNGELVSEALNSGAEILAVMWQACYRTLATTSGINVRHFIDIVGESLGINYEDKYRKYKLWNDVDRVLEDASEFISANGYSKEEIKPYLQKYLYGISPTFC